MSRWISVVLFAIAPSLYATISGSVLSKGAPVEGAQISLYRPEPLLALRERLIAGREREALAMASNRKQITTSPVKAAVPANGEIEVNLVFRTDVTVQGTVTEDGKPAPLRAIMFSNGSVHATAQTDGRGEYEITGIEPGTYEVRVQGDSGDAFTTQREIGRSMILDVAILYATMQGRVIDESGAAQQGVSVSIKTEATDDQAQATTAADGTFTARVSEAKSYVVTAEKKGFATAVQKIDSTRTPVVLRILRILRSGALRVRLTDARDGKTLDGYVAATNDKGLLAGRASAKDKDGSFPVTLAPGAYRVSVSANRYASQSVRVNVPYEGELRFALTPGGHLVVRSEQPSNDLVKLIMQGGEEYVRCQCNGIAEIRLNGTSTTIENVAPGRYTMQVLDQEGRVKTSYPVTIEEGRTTTAELHIPQ